MSRRTQRSNGFVKGRDVTGGFEIARNNQNHGRYTRLREQIVCRVDLDAGRPCAGQSNFFPHTEEAATRQTTTTIVAQRGGTVVALGQSGLVVGQTSPSGG